MNAVGRQGQRSGASAVHHQRQYSDNLLDSSSSNGRWLQSNGLQHLHSSNTSLPPLQDYGYYGGGQGSRMYRNAPRNFNGGSEFFTEPSSPPVNSRPSGQRKNGEDPDSPSGFSPGLLDLHSFDTELLPEVGFLSVQVELYCFEFYKIRLLFCLIVPRIRQLLALQQLSLLVFCGQIPLPGQYDAPSLYRSVPGRNFDDSESYLANSKQTGRVRGVPDNNLMKSYAADKEKASNVAKIKVVVRKRPLNKKELAKNEDDIITIESRSSSLTVHETKLKVDLTEYVEKHEFVFDAVLNEEVSNDEVRSGKTYTMKPLPLKASRDILRLMHHTYRNQGFQLFFSFFEIYGGKLFDLLSDRKKLCMREDGKQQVCIVGLQEYKVSDVETIQELIEKGNATRSTGITGANEESSRSHAILQLAIKRSADGSESKPLRVVGKLSFIDLAGSERGADTTDNDKQTRMEGAEINKSLLALKECIRALDNDQGHIPFRGSKLTEVLRDSFVGDSRTVMISCISPTSGSCEHTLNTLRYADREEFDVSEEFQEPEKPLWKKNGKVEAYGISNLEDKVRRANGQTKWKDPPKFDTKNLHTDDDLNTLLKEEEDLVSAHRRQVEETMDIVREEMNLLVEADQPGNQLDDYISRLNAILSQKAAGILQLQNRLAHFQRRLKEHNVLVSSDC
ncbi:hypothetical protein HYC85_028287 [Camellia sinensis]|uniref:Kinesin-like protein n=1 Tax=Camellia sinensis TaxID=4442 RepID=A0A7J7FYQ0_CAMSI|nr:hypothetical protein HYC85_028287 [Camellia sinensis]